MRLTQPGVTGGSSHPGVRAFPAVQCVCAQVPWLAEQARLPQTFRTSSTQVASQKPPELVQQVWSSAQTAATHGSHPATSGPPTSHFECEQAPAPGQSRELFWVRGPADAEPAEPSQYWTTGLTRYQ